MNAITAWSFSAWDMWRECPAKYKYAKIDKLGTTDKPAFLKGRQVHDGIAKFLTREIDTLPPAVTSKIATRTYNEFRTFDNIVVEQQWGFDRQWKPTGWFAKGPHATWLRTIVDAGILYDDMTAEVIDHKTGKPRGSYDDQLELFALSTMRHLPAVTNVTTRLQFVEHEVPPVIHAYPASDVPKLIDKWEGKVRPMFEDTAFLPRPGDRCRWCDFSRSNGGPCRYG